MRVLYHKLRASVNRSPEAVGAVAQEVPGQLKEEPLHWANAAHALRLQSSEQQPAEASVSEHAIHVSTSSTAQTHVTAPAA